MFAIFGIQYTNQGHFRDHSSGHYFKAVRRI
jgi:hypothetical protein